jgi:hypothetical protein
MTCFDQLSWFSKDVVFAISPKIQSLDNEAWTKGWPDYKGITVTQEIFIKNFFWLKTWFFGHGIQIFKKLSFFIIFIFISYLIIKKIDNKNKIKNKNEEIKYIETQKKIKFLLLLSFLGTLLWFFRFPVFRYGSSYVILFIIIFSILLIGQNTLFYKNNINLYKFFNKSLIIIFLLFSTKHIIRIYNNFDHDYHGYPWPKIYSQSKDAMTFFIRTEPVIINGIIAYYLNKTDDGCGYNASPCTGLIPSKIIFTIKNSYKFYNLEK